MRFFSFFFGFAGYIASNFFNGGHFPNVVSNNFYSCRNKCGVFYCICFYSLAILVSRVVKLYHCGCAEVGIAYNKIDVFTAYFVELALPVGIFSNSYQSGHGYLGKNNLIGQSFFQSMKQNLLRFANWIFLEVGRCAGLLIPLVSSFFCLFKQKNDYGYSNQKKYKFHFLPFSSFVGPRILACAHVFVLASGSSHAETVSERIFGKWEKVTVTEITKQVPEIVRQSGASAFVRYPSRQSQSALPDHCYLLDSTGKRVGARLGCF